MKCQGRKGHAGVDTLCKEKEDPRQDYAPPRGHTEITPITKAFRNVLVRRTPASLSSMVALCTPPVGEVVT